MCWGVSLSKYWGVLALMVVTTFIGAYIGKLVVKRVKDTHYKFWIKVVISVLAVRLLVKPLFF